MAELTVNLNPYFSHVHVKRHLLYSWLQSDILMHESECCCEGWSSGSSRRELTELSCCISDSVSFNDILYIIKTHTVCCPLQPWAELQLQLHNASSLTFIGNVWGVKLLLDGLAAIRWSVQHCFYETTQTLLFCLCEMLKSFWYLVSRGTRH